MGKWILERRERVVGLERERVKFENEERECILGLYIEP